MKVICPVNVENRIEEPVQVVKTYNDRRSTLNEYGAMKFTFCEEQRGRIDEIGN